MRDVGSFIIKIRVEKPLSHVASGQVGTIDLRIFGHGFIIYSYIALSPLFCIVSINLTNDIQL